jgi:uncharacterized iron-regulated membrane protein
LASCLRNALFWVHLAVGAVAALFILNMAVSGILIAYEVPITQWAERSQTQITTPGTTRLDVETLIIRAQQERPQDRFYRMEHHSDPAASEGFFDTGENSTVLYLNPYTGEVMGDGKKGLRQFFYFMTRWHRWLAMTGENRQTGKAITGAVSLAFFGLLLSGLYLWLPKKWSRKTMGQIAIFRSGLTGKARDWNWHNVVGIWCAPLLLITTLTGILMSYTWAQNILFLVGGESPPLQHVQPARPKPNAAAPKPAVAATSQLNPLGLNQLLAVAETKRPGWKAISFVLPTSPDSPITFFISSGAPGDSRPDLTARLVLERHTGAVLTWDPYENKQLGAKLQEWVVPVHTGQIGGVAGESLAVLAAGGAIMLAWTGLSLAWRRFFGGGKISLEAIPAAPNDLIPETPETPSRQ